MLWDESSWEKPESRQLEDLGPTRSSQAARLTHIKPGYYTPPGRPVCVPGMQWLAVLLVGRLVEQGTHVHPRERSSITKTGRRLRPIRIIMYMNSSNHTYYMRAHTQALP